MVPFGAVAYIKKVGFLFFGGGVKQLYPEEVKVLKACMRAINFRDRSYEGGMDNKYLKIKQLKKTKGRAGP